MKKKKKVQGYFLHFTLLEALPKVFEVARNEAL